MEKLNIAEILKDCPKGMELDCTMFDNVTFIGVNSSRKQFPIEIAISGQRSKYLTKEGCFHDSTLCPEAKCVIFPKGKTTWEGFQRPFKDGDVIFTHANCLKVGVGNTWISIYKENRNGGVATYVDYAEDGDGYYSDLDGDKAFLCMEEDILRQRFATEEEKQKLFDAIKTNGYKWNAETKTLEKLIEPKFKVGDRVLWNYDTEIPRTISKVQFASKRGYVYWINCEGCSSGWWDETELTPIPNKFDITTLNPFDKVLVRRDDTDYWKPAFWGRRITSNNFPFITSYGATSQAIPFKSNEHLLGTTDNCDEYYKTW